MPLSLPRLYYRFMQNRKSAHRRVAALRRLIARRTASPLLLFARHTNTAAFPTSRAAPPRKREHTGDRRLASRKKGVSFFALTCASHLFPWRSPRVGDTPSNDHNRDDGNDDDYEKGTARGVRKLRRVQMHSTTWQSEK